MKLKHCDWCDNKFEPKVKYQIYCSAECRQEATKEKIAARYLITRRQKRKNKVRKCKSCGEDLSIYNDDPLCNQCSINPVDVKKVLKQIKGLSNGKK